MGWKAKKLDQFDTDRVFQQKRLKKHGGGREEYVAFLQQNVDAKLASETKNLQATMPANVDLTRMNTMERQHNSAEMDADTFTMEDVSKEEFGSKADSFRDHAGATGEDDDMTSTTALVRRRVTCSDCTPIC